MKTLTCLVLSLSVALWGAGCGESASDSHAKDADTHTHEDGSTHESHPEETAEAEDHAHDETPLESVTIGGMMIELAQGHGSVAAGQEGHLVVKLPHNDNGATIVRAWIGSEDPTLSHVGLGEYAPSHDDYDIHAIAPDQLSDDAKWWIEVEKPDGTRAVGSAIPIMD